MTPMTPLSALREIADFDTAHSDKWAVSKMSSIARQALASVDAERLGSEDLRNKIADLLLSRVFAPEQEIYRVAREIVTLSERAHCGWKLMPVEPTDEIVKAGAWEWCRHNPGEPYDKEIPAIYRAMLAASPSPPPASDITPERIRKGDVVKEYLTAHGVSLNERK